MTEPTSCSTHRIAHAPANRRHYLIPTSLYKPTQITMSLAAIIVWERPQAPIRAARQAQWRSDEQPSASRSSLQQIGEHRH
jgi:hypothetical protein